MLIRSIHSRDGKDFTHQWTCSFFTIWFLMLLLLKKAALKLVVIRMNDIFWQREVVCFEIWWIFYHFIESKQWIVLRIYSIDFIALCDCMVVSITNYITQADLRSFLRIRPRETENKRTFQAPLPSHSSFSMQLSKALNMFTNHILYSLAFNSSDYLTRTANRIVSFVHHGNSLEFSAFSVQFRN